MCFFHGYEWQILVALEVQYMLDLWWTSMCII